MCVGLCKELQGKIDALEMDLRLSRVCTEEYRLEVKRLKACTDSVGADGKSEDDLISEGVRFGDYEKGFNAAIEIINRRMFV